MAMEPMIDWLRRNFGTEQPRFYVAGRWTYSGDWLNGPFISGDDPMPTDVHAQWVKARDEEAQEERG